MRDRLALTLLDAEAARAGDSAAVDAGDTWAGLMDRAAGHLARAIVLAGGHGYGLRVAIVVGKGNNGGDGWAAARRLGERGAQAWVIAPDGSDVEVSAEAAANRAAWIERGGRTSEGLSDLDAALAWCDVAVDALLGTGTRGAPRGPAADAVAALRRAHADGTTVVACDIPSGVSSDDGVAEVDAAVVADLTVTFGGLKRGLLLHPGAENVGRVIIGDLGPRYPLSGADGASGEPGPGEAGDPADAGDRDDEAGAGSGDDHWSALTPAGAAPSELPVTADKRARGVVLAVAGAVGTAGAAALTAAGALRAGAGLVTVAVPDTIRSDVAAVSDAGVMIRPLPSDQNGAVDADAVHGLPELDSLDAVVAGPGLGHGPGADAVVEALRGGARRLVLDADAINVHRGDPDRLADHAGALVLTPHERELARIGGGEDGPDAWAHRVERVPELARRYDATIVVKGPGTMVVAPDGRVWVCPLGSPALGSGGTGDVLAGIIAAAIATADDVPFATAQAVWWHAAAGERAGSRVGGRASATDLLDELPGVLADLGRWRDGSVRAGESGYLDVPPGVPADVPPDVAAVVRAPGALPWDRWRAGAHPRPSFT